MGDRGRINAETNSDAGWSALVARRAHDPKVAGPNPGPATINSQVVRVLRGPNHANSGRREAREGCRYALRGP
jgi:hypothetical protein